MQDTLEEIRNLLKVSMNITHAAENGTTTTNIKVTAHGLAVGNWILNSTRSISRMVTAIIDANNFTVAEIAGQIATDSIEFQKLKNFYVGKVPNHAMAINDLPLLMIYGTGTRLVEDKLTTNKDKYEFAITIEIVTNIYEKVSIATIGASNILLNQKNLIELTEKRSGGVPIAPSIFGSLRRNIVGTNYLYSLPAEADYKFQDDDGGTVYCRAIISLNAVSKYNLRS